LQCIISRTTKAKALTAALYAECNTMTIDTQVINKTKYKYDNISDTIDTRSI